MSGEGPYYHGRAGSRTKGNDVNLAGMKTLLSGGDAEMSTPRLKGNTLLEKAKRPDSEKERSLNRVKEVLLPGGTCRASHRECGGRRDGGWGGVRRQPSISDTSAAFRGASIIFNASVLLDRGGGGISGFGVVRKADDLKYSGALRNVPECLHVDTLRLNSPEQQLNGTVCGYFLGVFFGKVLDRHHSHACMLFIKLYLEAN